MKVFSTLVLLAFIAVNTLAKKCPAKLKTLNSHIFSDGGSGPYKAIMTEEEGLPDFTIYRPENLEAAVEAEGRLPIVLFGNGGCGRSSLGHSVFLTDIASYGYVVAAVGPYALEVSGDFTFPFTEEQIQSMGKDANDLIDVALNYLEEKNKDKGSIFYKHLKTNKTAAMGYSCGGLQALIISARHDDRIKTTVALSSGANSPGDFLDTLFTKDQLNDLTKPIIYIIGGDEDIARPNALDDYERLEHIPVVLAGKPDVGHEGTYDQPYGGAFCKMSRAWLDFEIKNDKRKSYKDLFHNGIIPTEFESDNWTVTQKNF